MNLTATGTNSPYLFRWPDSTETYEIVHHYEVSDPPEPLTGGSISIAVGWREAFGKKRRRVLVFRSEINVLVEFVGTDQWDKTADVICQLRQQGNSRAVRDLPEVPDAYHPFEVGPANKWIVGPYARRGIALRLTDSDYLQMIHVGLIRESHKRRPGGPKPTRETRPAPPARETRYPHPPAGPSHSDISERLLAYSQTFDPVELIPTVDPEAGPLIATDPFAFALAACLDRGARSEILWTVPIYLKRSVGHIDPLRLAMISEADLHEHLRGMPHRPRYLHDAPRTIKELALLVAQEFGGDAARVWEGRSASEVKRTFEGIHGVGPGIASMILVLLKRTRGIHFDDLDYRTMDIKPDVHTMRVLYRLGVSTAQRESDAVEAARRLRPEYPGEVDGALWMIGRNWCRAAGPKCGDCPVEEVCLKVDV